MGPLNGTDSPPWYSFDGFTFETVGMAVKFSEQVQHALTSTRHIESPRDDSINAREYNSKLLALVNLCALFKNLLFFKPYMALPDFWEVICDKWGLLVDYRMVRFLVHMYAGARTSFLAELNTPATFPQDTTSGLSAVLASLVDEWRVIYDDYFDLRVEAYEYPSNNLEDDFETAKQMWSIRIGSTNVKLLRDSDEVKHENDDWDRMKLEDVPYRSSASSSSDMKEELFMDEKYRDYKLKDNSEAVDHNMGVDNHSDNHLCVAHDNQHRLSSGIDLLSQSSLQQSPVQFLKDPICAEPSTSHNIQSRDRNTHYTSTWDTPPTVSPLTSPIRTNSDSPLSIDQPNKSLQHELDTNAVPAIPANDNGFTSRSSVAISEIVLQKKTPPRATKNYTSIWDTPPTVSPLTSPTRTNSNSPLSIDQVSESPHHELVDSNVVLEMPAKDKVLTSRSPMANSKGVLQKKTSPQAIDKTHLPLPVRPTRRRTLFPSSEDCTDIPGPAESGGDVAMDDVEDAAEDQQEWQKKGYTFPDAEDHTQINGSKIVGGQLTLAGMIRQYMQKEREKEEAELKKKGAAKSPNP